jgi:hypothetical protein
MLMWLIVRDGRETAELLAVTTVGGVLLMVVVNLAEVQPSFARIGTG